MIVSAAAYTALDRPSRSTFPSADPLTNRTSSYVPPRSQWPAGVGHRGSPPLETIQGSPATAELAARHSPPIAQQAPVHAPSRARVNSSDNYYEDVDPRFSGDLEVDTRQQAPIPTVLVPGGQPVDDLAHHDPYYTGNSQPQRQPLNPTPSYDSVNDGPESDNSNFTSISQRGVNPQWQPEGQGQGYGVGGVPNRNRPQQQRDFLLASNPDFEVPGGRGGRGQGRGGRGGLPIQGVI